MKIRVILKKPNGAYVDAENGQTISGEGPQLVDLTPFICGLIFRKEAEIYETIETRLEDGAVTLENLPWSDLKVLAVKRGMELSARTNKQEVLEFLGEKKEGESA